MGGCESSKKPKKGTDGIKIKEVSTKEYPIFKVLMLGDVNVCTSQTPLSCSADD
jgi:hypothetical protein